MKKLIYLLALCIFSTWSYGQDKVQHMLRGEVQGSAIYGPGTEFYCTAGASFSQDPATTGTAITSDVMFGYKVYDNFWSLSGNITSIDWWGVLIDQNFSFPCTENPKNFEISFYQDNAGNIGSQVYSFNGSVTGNPTGFTFAGFPVYKFSATLPAPVSGLSGGWVSVEGNPVGTCGFLWLNSATGDSKSYQSNNGWRTEDLSFCLYTTAPIPLPNWPIYLGVFLIAAFMVFRYRRRLA